VRRIDTPYVFHFRGKKINSVKESFRAACKRAGIENFRFHDLRHTAITRWVKAGVPESAIMMVLGHKTRKVFDRYVNLKPEDVRLMILNSERKENQRNAVLPKV